MGGDVFIILFYLYIFNLWCGTVEASGFIIFSIITFCLGNGPMWQTDEGQYPDD